jgi:multiple sugar transport system permease protein
MNSLIKNRYITNKALATIMMFIVALIVMLPFVHMVSTSLKQEIDVYNYPIEIIPSNIKNNYYEVWAGDYKFFQYYLNSIKVTALTTIGLLLTSSMAAFGFAKMKFKGRDALFILYLATLMIPEHNIIVPKFIIFRFLGIYDTHLALILPRMFNAFGVFLLRQFMLSIPDELLQSAKIDGAGSFRTWLRIALPLTKTAMLSLTMISIVWSWNDYLNPLIYLKSESLYTITLGLLRFIDETGKKYSLIMAACVSATILPIILFLFGQKYFIEGLTSGAVKG